MRVKFNQIVLTLFWLAIPVLGFSDLNSQDSIHQKKDKKYISPRQDSGFFSLLDLNFPGMEDVKRSIENGDPEMAKKHYLVFRRERSKARWHIDPSAKPLKPVSTEYPKADQVMKNIISPYLGAPQVTLPDDIDWEFNPVDPSEPHFTKEWTWSALNRMSFWNTLGEAYWHTLNENYAKKWVAQMTDWVKSYPVPLDAQFDSTLTWRTIESGIRMYGSWMNSYYYFLHSSSFTPDAHATFVKGIIEHGQRLEKITVGYPERSSNWVTMECNGLGTIGILFPELKMAESFKTIAFGRLLTELDKQVYPDGAQFELSPGYHQLAQNNFMRLARLAQKNNIAIPGGYFEKLKKMYAFNLIMMDPSGNLPPFNDSHPLSARSSLKVAHEVWGDEYFLFGASSGKEGKKPDFDSYYLDWAGYYVMRSGWEIQDNCLYFDAGPVGHGHEHEDMLNLYLYSQGEILLTEAGNFPYDASKWRRYAISTSGHNTIVVDGKEQHRRGFPGGRVVKEPIPNPWVTSPLFDFGRGIYSSGYQENIYKPVAYRPREYSGPRDTSVRHTRNVIFMKPYYYMVVDFLDGQGDHRYDALFHLNAPDARLIESNQSVHTLRDGNVQLGLYPMDAENMKVTIVKRQEEPVLGWIPAQKNPIPTVVFTKNEETPATFSTFLYPYNQEVPDVHYKAIMMPHKSVWGRLINTPHETMALLLKRDGLASPSVLKPEMVPEFSTDASMVIVRRPHGKEESYYGFNAISEFRRDDLHFTLGESSSLVFVKKADNVYQWYNPTGHEINLNMTAPYVTKLNLPAGLWMQLDAEGIMELKDLNTLF